MQSQNPFVADFLKLATGAAGTFAGMTREAREGARERLREALGGMDFVSRDEFDAVKAMAAAARDENELLTARLAALETRLARLESDGGAAAATRKAGETAADPSGGITD